jgi:hypothetical protein
MTAMMHSTNWEYLELYGKPCMFRSDPDIAASPFHHYSSSNLSKLINEYSKWIKQYLDEGWRPFLLSFMFKPLCNGGKMVQMNDEIDRVYSTLITRVVRNPRSPFQSHLSPILIVVPDFPVRKRQKQSLNNLSINCGLHMHGILVMPPSSRLKQDVVSHFKEHEPLYVKNRLLRLDVEVIDSNLAYVVDYAFKSVKKHKVDFDDILIFPKPTGVLRERIICL